MNNAYKIEDIDFKYAEESVIRIDKYEFQEGLTHALVGPNGAGKSTLLNLLSLLSKPLSGKITVLGEEVNDENRLALRRRIGYVQQRPYLFNASVSENIAIGMKLRGISRQLREKRTNNILEQLALSSLSGKRAHELSGGEIQKVALARSLVLEPEILILDEPFTYLDKSFGADLEALLLSIREHKTQTVLLTMHDHILAHFLADHVCSIVNGRLMDESSVNLFHGTYYSRKSVFDTGNLEIDVGSDRGDINIIAVEPAEIVLSREELDSSMRNRYRGQVIALSAHGDRIEVSVNAGEKFHVIISKQALDELGIGIGSEIWVSFKSSAVKSLS